MKRRILALVVFGLLVFGIILINPLGQRRSARGRIEPPDSHASKMPENENHRAAPDRRLTNSDIERIPLESLGEVPVGADIDVWKRAQRTSWWGKRLDPKAFWTNRVVWLDSTNESAARRKGRMYPPIPYGDTSLATLSDKDIPRWNGVDIEGPNIGYRVSQRELTFWDTFIKTHPRPPEDIQRHQLDAARIILGGRADYEHRGNPARTTEARLLRGEEIHRERAVELGFPSEALSLEALHWAYVMSKRAEYQQIIERHQGNDLPQHVREREIQRLLQNLPIDPKYVTEDLTQEQIIAANAWKLDYLRRLKRENVDPSYVNAYLQAWKLKPEEVFGAANRVP